MGPFKNIRDQLKNASTVCVTNPHSQTILSLPLMYTSAPIDGGDCSVPEPLKRFGLSM